MASLYELLGIGEDASLEDIKRAYRKKALKHHPDRYILPFIRFGMLFC
jgi:curved DNA-binding protein CbpA